MIFHSRCKYDVLRIADVEVCSKEKAKLVYTHKGMQDFTVSYKASAFSDQNQNSLDDLRGFHLYFECKNDLLF